MFLPPSGGLPKASRYAGGRLLKIGEFLIWSAMLKWIGGVAKKRLFWMIIFVQLPNCSLTISFHKKANKRKKKQKRRNKNEKIN